MLGFMPVSTWWARQGLNLRPHPCEGSYIMEMRGFPSESAGTESDSLENIPAFSDHFLTKEGQAAAVLFALGDGDRSWRIAKTLTGYTRELWSTEKVRMILRKLEAQGRVYRHPCYSAANDIYWVPLRAEMAKATGNQGQGDVG